jgi:NAD(P)-dependent dehydrogenase (short-subunit alcohol dehydrogenase family)
LTVQGDLFDVRDTRVVVTGAASGLGFAMAEVMSDCGARVTLADVDGERLEEATGRLGGQARSARVDVSDRDQVERLFAGVVEEQGGVDVVFANAGISPEPGVVHSEGGFGAFDRGRWDRVLGVNLNGVVFTMQAAAERMKRQGSGRIVVTVSTAGLRPDPLVGYSYSATKFAAVGLVRQAALELAPHGVHVNAIAPGPFHTRIGGDTEIPDSVWESVVALGRMAEPEELKPVALLLGSPASSFMTGAVVTVDGGQMLLSPRP